MKNIRIAYIAKEMPVNGISTVIMNYCRKLNKDKFKITIFSGAPIDNQYEVECKKLGIKLEKMPPKRGGNPLKYYIYLWKNINSKKFDIVHVHGNSATITIELLMALIRGVKIRIAHSHNTTCDKLLIHKLLGWIFKKIYTYGFACSKEAGEWLFKNGEFEVLPNGFDTQEFKFNEEDRNRVRKQLKLTDKFVIGHVGMFNNQKNHLFLLEVFEKIADNDSNAHLLLIGDGPDFETIQNVIRKHPYADKIICYGNSKNISELYSAMDVFVFPSKHEGLGIVLLEAQINGLECFASNVIPKEVDIINKINWLSLDDGFNCWANSILDVRNKLSDRIKVYDDNLEKIQKYDIEKNTVYLENIYIKLINLEKR